MSSGSQSRPVRSVSDRATAALLAAGAAEPAGDAGAPADTPVPIASHDEAAAGTPITGSENDSATFESGFAGREEAGDHLVAHPSTDEAGELSQVERRQSAERRVRVGARELGTLTLDRATVEHFQCP